VRNAAGFSSSPHLFYAGNDERPGKNGDWFQLFQIGFGGTAIVQENQVSGNDYTPKSFVSCGLLMFEGDGVRASQNHYANNERNVCVFGRGGGEFNPEP